MRSGTARVGIRIGYLHDVLRCGRWMLPVVLSLLLATPAAAFAQTDAPGFVYAKPVRGHLIAVNWEPPRNETDPDMTYRVYRAEATTVELPAFPGAAWQQVGNPVVGRTTTSLCDSEPKANSTRYWYVVTAQNTTQTASVASPVNSLAYGWSDGSYQRDKYLPADNLDSYKWYIGPTTLPPLEPANVTLSGADTTITVSWDPVPSTNIVGYHIYRATSSGGNNGLDTSQEVGYVASPATEFVDTGVERYRHYWYRVVAKDSTGATGFPSIEKHFRTVASFTPPSPHTASSAAPDAETCSVCHQLHAAPGPSLLKIDEDTEVTLCLTCHDGTGSVYDVRREYTDTHSSSHPVTVTAGDGLVEAKGYFTCVDCHTAHGGAEPSPKLLSVDGAKSGNAVCYGSGCHGPVAPNDFDFSAAFENSVHNTSIPDPDSGTKVKCSTCHQPHTSPNEWLWNSTAYRACFQCHGGGQVQLGSPDIYTKMTLSNDPDTSHDVLQRAQDENGTYMACQNCHNTHAVTRESPLVDPRSPGIGASDQWIESRDAPLAVADAEGSSHLLPRYNRFCFSCHGNAGLPTLAETAPWVDAPDDNGHLTKNIETDWGGDPNDVTTPRIHGSFSSGTGNAQLDPTMGYGQGQTLSCMVCHEPHGTINNFNLRGDVPRADGSVGKERMLLVPQLDVSEETTPTFDTRFFCGSCHVGLPEGHTSTNDYNPGSNNSMKNYNWFPSGCTNAGCHTHGTTTKRRF